MPAKLNLDWDLRCKPTSRQIGNVRTNVYETYMVPKNGKPFLTDKSVETYYVDQYGNRASVQGKKSEYHYNNDGTLKNATIQRERPAAHSGQDFEDENQSQRDFFDIYVVLAVDGVEHLH